MTYKEKKLKQFSEILTKPTGTPSVCLDFLSSTIDEILGCLPAETKNKNLDFYEGFMVCRNLFLFNLEQKAGEL